MLNAGVSKLWPTKPFRQRWKKLCSPKFCWFCRMWHIPKQSHYLRRPPLDIFCNSLCGPQKKKFGSPCFNTSLAKWMRLRTSMFQPQSTDKCLINVKSFFFCIFIVCLAQIFIQQNTHCNWQEKKVFVHISWKFSQERNWPSI